MNEKLRNNKNALKINATEFLHMRVNQAEKEQWYALAALKKLKLSEWVRIALNKQID